MRLHQAVAILEGNKEGGNKKKLMKDKMTALYQLFKSGTSAFIGFVKMLHPKDDAIPSSKAEEKLVQMNAVRELNKLFDDISPTIDMIATVDTGNQEASANVPLLGLENVAVSTLLQLEKLITHLQLVASHAPRPSADYRWGFDKEQNELVAVSPVVSQKTERQQVPVVVHPGTDKHPPQAQLVDRAVELGRYETWHHSGGIPADKLELVLKDFTAALDAIKMAREEANNRDVKEQKIAAKLKQFLLRNLSQQ